MLIFLPTTNVINCYNCQTLAIQASKKTSAVHHVNSQFLFSFLHTYNIGVTITVEMHITKQIIPASQDIAVNVTRFFSFVITVANPLISNSIHGKINSIILLIIIHCF